MGYFVKLRLTLLLGIRNADDFKTTLKIYHLNNGSEVRAT